MNITNYTSRAMPMQEYARICRNLALPSSPQILEFVRFVQLAHSWYKRLRSFPETVPFHFFLDPAAGFEKTVSRNGALTVHARVEQGFHHSWIPTAEYTRRFGFLAFSCTGSTGAGDLTGNEGAVVATDTLPAVWNPEGECLWRIPDEIHRAGMAALSSEFAFRHELQDVQVDAAVRACDRMLFQLSSWQFT